jgi:hypothetical protein
LLNTILGSFSSGVVAVPGSYESIATVTVGSGGTANVEFTSIPATYTHLQIRGIANKSSAGDVAMRLEFNSDTGTNYTYHFLDGNSTSAIVGGTGSSELDVFYPISTTSNIFSAVIIDVLDYKNTNKYKTARILGGTDLNGSGRLGLKSGVWRNTNAITSVNLKPSSGNFSQYSQFALYGIKGE